MLVIDDDFENAKLFCEILSKNYECSSITDSTKALETLKEFKPEIILLDYKMPGLLGTEVCGQIKSQEQWKNVVIIFVSGAATESERILALELGADDFIAKPFNIRELELRIKARSSNKESGEKSELCIGNLKMDLLSRQVFVGDHEVQLTPKQFEILKLLISNKNNLVTREQCLKYIWGDIEVTPRNVDSQINYLRRRISSFNGKITAIPSLGYRLEGE